MYITVRLSCIYNTMYMCFLNLDVRVNDMRKSDHVWKGRD